MMECPQGYKRINATFCQGTVVPTIDDIYFEYQFSVTDSLIFRTLMNESSTLYCIWEKMLRLLWTLSKYWQLLRVLFCSGAKKNLLKHLCIFSFSLVMYKNDFVRIHLLCFSAEIHCSVCSFAKQWTCRLTWLSQIKLAIVNNFYNHESIE